MVIYNLNILNPMQRGIFASTVHAQNTLTLCNDLAFSTMKVKDLITF